MKIVILLSALKFLVSDILCNEDILSKFHQNIFKLKDVRMQVMNYDENYINFYTIKAFKHNRTTTAHNCTINLKVTMKDKLEVLVQGYKFLSNEYRHFPIRFQVNLRKTVEANVLGSGDIRKCGNLTTFYFYKDIDYYYCNYVIDETRFPPLIPNGRFKMEVHFLYLDREVALQYIFFEVYTPIKYPKK